MRPGLLRNDRAARTAALLVNLLLVLFIARIAAEITWKMKAPAPAAGMAPARKETAAKARPAARLPGAAALLFGEAEKKTPAAAPARPAPKKLPPTRLALVLKGTVVPGHGAAYAIVAAKKGGAEVVASVGDELPGGAVVERIYPDRIEIRFNGRLEVLEVKEDKAAAAAAPARSGAAAGWKIPASYRKKWLNDLPTLGRKVRAMPVKDKNGRVGFRLISRDRKLLDTVGLKNGDVVYEVNGIPLSDPAQALKAAGELMKRKEVTVLFGRNGRVESRVYRLEE